MWKRVSILDDDGTPKEVLRRTFQFDTFAQAWHVLQGVAKFAEAVHHHPWFRCDYGELEFRLSTSEANYTVTRADYDLADRIDELAMEATDPWLGVGK